MKAQKKSDTAHDSAKVNGYLGIHDHLLDELRWLNRLIAAHVLRLRQVDFYENAKNFRGFFISDHEIDALLKSDVFGDADQSNAAKSQDVAPLLEAAHSLREAIDARVANSLANNIPLPFARLQKIFGLNNFERHSLLICLAPAIDARYQKLYAYLQNDLNKTAPSLDLIFELLAVKTEDRLPSMATFHSESPLLYFQLLETEQMRLANQPFQQALSIDERIMSYVLGLRCIDRRLSGHLRFAPEIPWDEVILDAALRAQLQKLGRLVVKNPRGGNFYLRGREGVGKKTIVAALCKDLEVPVAIADARYFPREPGEFRKTLRLVLREGLLWPCAICFDHVEALLQQDEPGLCNLNSFLEEINASGWLIFLCSEQAIPKALLDLTSIYPIDIPFPDFAAQQDLWKLYLNKRASTLLQAEITELAMRFRLTGGQIAHAVHLAQQFAVMMRPADAQISPSNLMMSCRLQSQPRLSTLARKIEPRYRWPDIVLPADQVTLLQEIANQVRNQRIVMDEWGFAKKLSLGQGISALFSGPSGTGKTMASEIIAGDLGLDLYKIDLSAVVSKYIGETEKNLSRLFDEAEHSNAILFFDEADALLGKRSEVKDAHDRFANIEIAYLLQKMEEYGGVTILATNLKKNIDDAFMRRIQFIVDFPFPAANNREQIWRGIFPQRTPVDEKVDFTFLANQFKITGGNIKNIGLNAAYLAASDGKVVNMEHLIRATRRELQKTGKLYSKADFGPYRAFL